MISSIPVALRMIERLLLSIDPRQAELMNMRDSYSADVLKVFVHDQPRLMRWLQNENLEISQ